MSKRQLNSILDLRIGDKVRLFYSENNDNNKLLHVRGFVDGRVIFRYWRFHKQRWEYEIWHPSFMGPFLPYMRIV